MSWEEKIIGGVGKPRFLIIEDENLCTNSSFESNLNDWVVGGDISAERITDVDSWRGDYCVRLTTVSSGGLGLFRYYYQPSTSDNIVAGNSYIIKFLARCEEKQRRKLPIIVYDNSGAYWESFSVYVGNEWEIFTVVLEMPLDSDNEMRIAISVNEYGDRYQPGYFRIDDFKIYKVIKEYNMPQPQAWLQTFDKVLKGRNELVYGDIKEYIRGWRYQMVLTFGFLTPVQEMIRQEISEAGAVIVFPHEDSMFCQKMLWDGEFERKYFYDKFLGHEGTIPMMATELIQKKPSDVVYVGGYAVDDDDWGIS